VIRHGAGLLADLLEDAVVPEVRDRRPDRVHVDEPERHHHGAVRCPAHVFDHVEDGALALAEPRLLPAVVREQTIYMKSLPAGLGFHRRSSKRRVA
jgi:hypothetical protein